MLPLRHMRSCTPISPDIGTIVLRCSEPIAAASQGVLPSYDFPITPMLPLLQG